MRYAIILAAGKGTRMKSLLPDKSKVSYEILGVPLLGYVMRALEPLGLDKIVTVLGFGGKAAETAEIAKADVVWQKEQKGTADAVKTTEPILGKLQGETLIVCGDTPLLRTETLRTLFEVHERNNDKLIVLGAKVEDPTGYGRMITDESGGLIRIVEEKDVNEAERRIDVVSTGVMIFENDLLFKHLSEIKNENKAGEYYLGDLIAIFRKNGYRIGTSLIMGEEEMLGANDRVQLARAGKLMRRRINERLMLSGVTIEDPEATYIGPDVTIGQDSEILAGTHVFGHSKIGKRNIIGPGSYILDTEIGDGNSVVMSHIVEAKLGNENEIGPFARIRKGTVVEDHCRVGNFMEVKNTLLKSGVKASHLSYLGDSDIGEETNVGCGTIIANYDGYNKTHTSIGKHVFVGSGSTLISPIVVADDSFIAAGSTITRNVETDELAIARSRQVNKAGYYHILMRKARAKKKLLEKQKEKK